MRAQPHGQRPQGTTNEPVLVMLLCGVNLCPVLDLAYEKVNQVGFAVRRSVDGEHRGWVCHGVSSDGGRLRRRSGHLGNIGRAFGRNDYCHVPLGQRLQPRALWIREQVRVERGSERMVRVRERLIARMC